MGKVHDTLMAVTEAAEVASLKCKSCDELIESGEYCCACAQYIEDCANGMYEDPDDWLYDDDGDEDDWLEQECGLGPDGQCSMAGTEHCDFVCPNRDSEDFAGSKAWNEKHKCEHKCRK